MKKGILTDENIISVKNIAINHLVILKKENFYYTIIKNEDNYFCLLDLFSFSFVSNFCNYQSQNNIIKEFLKCCKDYEILIFDEMKEFQDYLSNILNLNYNYNQGVKHD